MKRVSLADMEMAYLDEGQGTPLLLVHGFPLDHSMWSAQISAFASDARVIAPDLRGFGQSTLGDVEPAAEFTIGRYADDLCALLDALAIKTPVDFCGFSMGGYIAWQFVARFPDRLQRLVLCDTRAVSDTEEMRSARIKMAENVAAWGAARVAEIMGPNLFAPRTLQTQPHVVEEVRRVVSGTDPAAIAVAQRAMASRPDVTSLLDTIFLPSLLLGGNEDAISSPAEMRQMADAMPQAKFVEIAGAGHMAPMEAPAAVNRALAEFLTTSA